MTSLTTDARNAYNGIPSGGTSARLGNGRDPYAPTSEDISRANEMARAWNAYNGIYHGGDEQWPLTWTKGTDPNPNVIVNRCGPAVETDVAWLFGESVSISVAGEDAPEEAQKYLDQAWGVESEDSSDDDKMALLAELATMGAITGHAYLKIVWDAQGAMAFPKLVVLDSQQVRVITDPHNVRVPVCYVIEYKMADPIDPGRGQGTFRQVIELHDPDGKALQQAPADDTDATWQIQDYWRGEKASVFAPLGEMRPWDYPWPPIEDCAHLAMPGRYYGRPRISPNAIGLNEAICMVASNIMTIALAHGHPILYTIRQGANQREIKYKPGTILEVASDVKAVQAYGDLKDMMQQEDDLRDDFDEQTHIPAHAFGRIDSFPRLPTSGVAFRLSYAALLSDIMKERRTYGALIRRVSQHILALKNAAWADLQITLGWQDPMPADDLQQAQVAQIMLNSGASKTTVYGTMGLDYDQELANLRQEQEDEQEMAANDPMAVDPLMAAQAMPATPGEPTAPTPQQQAQGLAAPAMQQQRAVAAKAAKAPRKAAAAKPRAKAVKP